MHEHASYHPANIITLLAWSGNRMGNQPIRLHPGDIGFMSAAEHSPNARARLRRQRQDAYWSKLTKMDPMKHRGSRSLTGMSECQAVGSNESKANDDSRLIVGFPPDFCWRPFSKILTSSTLELCPPTCAFCLCLNVCWIGHMQVHLKILRSIHVSTCAIHHNS